MAVVLASSETGKASGIGLLIILALVGGTYLLYRSLTKHVRRIPPSFDDRGPDGRPLENQPPRDER